MTGRKEKKKTARTECLSKTEVKSLAFFEDGHYNANAGHCCSTTGGCNETHLGERNNALLCLAKFGPKSPFCMCLCLEK